MVKVKIYSEVPVFLTYAGGNKLRNSVLKMDDQLGTQTLKGIANRWTADDSNAQVRMYLDIPPAYTKNAFKSKFL